MKAGLLALRIALRRWLGVWDKTTTVVADSPTAPSPPEVDPPPAPAPMSAVGDVKRLAASSNALGFDLYAKVRGGSGNLALSPASISAALAMTYGGARGETEAQMKRVLHLDGTRDAAMTEWGNLSRALQDPGRPLKLRIANRLFGEKTVRLEQPFLDRTKEAYGAPLEPTDFKNAAEPSRGRINGWVEDQTETRIKELLPPDSIDAETRLVLVNAIYFLADWADPFLQHATFDETFHVSATTAKRTPTMHGGGPRRIVQADGVTVLELPYQGDDAAMLIILPDRVDGLASVEASLSAATLDAWMAALSTKRVSIALPRFEVSPQPSMSLGEELKKLGMTDAFDADLANFTGIANPTDPRERLQISGVFHKAFVKVDEKGTEAAAATAVLMPRAGGAPSFEIDFKADHPFLFVIVDKKSGLALFVGRVVDPTAT